MPYNNPMHHFTAISAGPEIEQMRSARGQVLAVLSNAVYLLSESGHILGIAGEDAEDGPFTLRVRNIDALLHLLRGRDSRAFAGTQTFLELAGVARIELGQANEWRPQAPTLTEPASERVKALRALTGMLEGSWCKGGTCSLAPYLYGSHRSLPLPSELPVLRRNTSVGDTVLYRLAQGVMEFQSAACELDANGASEALVELLGMGTGLTPSGDDIVAGILASLVWQERLGTMPSPFVEKMAQTTRLIAPTRTNHISVRLLWHAGNGLLYAPAMELGAPLLAGDVAQIAGPARRLLAIGHSSGADLAAGIIAGIVAGLEVESRAAIR